MNRYVVEIEPMGAVRMTQRGKYVKGNAQRYLAYKDKIGWDLKSRNFLPTTKPCAVKIQFFMPIPQSLSKNKQNGLDGAPHAKKPDIDNLIKGVFDSANKILWEDDNQVVKVEATKRYDMFPRIEIEVTT